jgi:hypothetical protein
MNKRRGQSPPRFDYLGQALEPKQLLEFIELPVFTKRWKELGLDDEADLSELQWKLMGEPTMGKPIQGAHSIRKTRFSPKKWKTGKSGATRVLYVYFERVGFILLCLIYGKSEVDDISPAVKRELNRLVDDVAQELDRRMSRTHDSPTAKR